jgi:hypothetical protein
VNTISRPLPFESLPGEIRNGQQRSDDLSAPQHSDGS